MLNHDTSCAKRHDVDGQEAEVDDWGMCRGTSGDASFRAAYFTPTFFKYNNSLVSGTQWVRVGGSKNVDEQPAMFAAATIIRAFQKLSPPGTPCRNIVSRGFRVGGTVGGK